MSYTPLSYISFSFFRSVFLASYPVFPFLRSFLFFLSRLSLSFSLVYLPARVYESFPLLESPICSLSSCLYLHLCLRSCSTSLVTSRLPTLLESIPLFLSLLSSYLSFFLSFFGRFSQLSLFSSLTPYTSRYGATTVPSVFFLPSINRIYLPVSASWPFFPLSVFCPLLVFKLSFFLFPQRSSLVRISHSSKEPCNLSRSLALAYAW